MTRLDYLLEINKEYKNACNANENRQPLVAWEAMHRVNSLCAELFTQYGVRIKYDKEADKVIEA